MNERSLMTCRPLNLLPIVVLALSLTLQGCGGDGKVPVYQVAGKVFHKGEPAEGALVVFYPVGHEKVDKEKIPPRPSGMVDEEGSFKLTTHEPNDGARAGDYQVSIVWFKGATNEERSFGGPGKEGTAGTKDLLNKKYAEPSQSGLKATISPGTNELEPFELE